MSIVKKLFLFVAIACLVAAVSACGAEDSGNANNNSGTENNATDGATNNTGSGSDNNGDGTNNDPAPESNEQISGIDMTRPIELSFYSEINTTNNDDDFMQEFGQYFQRKYPNVTFKNNSYQSQTGNNLEKTIAAGIDFDLAQMSFIRTDVYIDMQVGSDIKDLIRKYNIDISNVDKVLIDQLEGAGAGQLIGLPYQINSQVLFYNKDIFDKFATDYPTDNMTWPELTDIVRRVTRIEDGIDYKGFALQQGAHILTRSNQMSIEPVDLTTNRATFVSDDRWKRFFDEFLPIYQIQGNDIVAISAVTNAFTKDKNMAMVLAYPNFYTLIPDDINWDMVTAPSMSDRPGLGMPPVPSTLAINATSPLRDETFLVALEMLSKDVQMERARKYAFSSVLTDPDIKAAIGADVPELQGKNTAVMQPSNMAPSITFTEFTADVVGRLGWAFNRTMEGSMDANTALREAEEAANRLIDEKIKAKQDN